MAIRWVILVLALAVPGLSAQETPPCQNPLDLPGRVHSAADGAAVSGASVVVPAVQLRVLTDGAGRFVVRGVCPGPLELSISHLAFGTAVLTATASRRERLDIRLEPRALPLEGLVVEVEPVVRQLERRRMAHGWKSDAFQFTGVGTEELPVSIPEYVAARAGHPLYACPRAIGDDRNCFPYRGRRKRVTVCLDEGPFAGGVPMLETFPPDAIGRVEFYPDDGLMKVYTREFLALSAEKPWLLLGAANEC
jgi:hypothetical protein